MPCGRNWKGARLSRRHLPLSRNHRGNSEVDVIRLMADAFFYAGEICGSLMGSDGGWMLIKEARIGVFGRTRWAKESFSCSRFREHTNLGPTGV